MTAKELFYEAMRRTDSGDREGFLECFTADVNWLVPGAELDGIEQVRGWVAPFWHGFPTFRHDIDRAVADSDDTVFAEGRWTGDHNGTLAMPDGELPPTGRTISFRFAIAVSRRPGEERVSSVHLYFDQLEFLGRLGVLPESAAA
jgi:ketosteroid isomerase-like protein